MPQQRKNEESARLRGERDQIKFIDLRFEGWQVGLWDFHVPEASGFIDGDIGNVYCLISLRIANAGDVVSNPAQFRVETRSVRKETGKSLHIVKFPRKKSQPALPLVSTSIEMGGGYVMQFFDECHLSKLKYEVLPFISATLEINFATQFLSSSLPKEKFEPCHWLC